MDTLRIRQAAQNIEECELALKWLREYGKGLTPRDKDAFSISIRLHYAGSCSGATDAAKVLESFARYSIEDIIAASIANCINTIEMESDVIRREVSPDA